MVQLTPRQPQQNHNYVTHKNNNNSINNRKYELRVTLTEKSKRTEMGREMKELVSPSRLNLR